MPHLKSLLLSVLLTATPALAVAPEPAGPLPCWPPTSDPAGPVSETVAIPCVIVLPPVCSATDRGCVLSWLRPIDA